MQNNTEPRDLAGTVFGVVAIGLLMAAHEQQKRRDLANLSSGSVQQVFSRMREWFAVNF